MLLSPVETIDKGLNSITPTPIGLSGKVAEEHAV
jgi:hypothetical protein